MPDTLTLEERMRLRQTPPFWWPETQTLMQIFLAIAIVSMVGYILQQLLSGEALKIDPSVRDLIVFIFGIVFGNFKDVYGFTYGGSAGEKQKSETINRSLDSKDKIIADGVAATAATATTTTEALKAVAGVVSTPDPVLTVDQQGRNTLKNGVLAYFTALPDDDAKVKFLAMSGDEQAAAAKAAGY